MTTVLEERIRDRLSPDWLTPSQKAVWEAIHRFDGLPHRVINVDGIEGTGKTFLGWLMEREKHATYGLWSAPPIPILPRLALDNAATDRFVTREVRPLVDKLGLRQIILLSRTRVDEPSMPVFELRVIEDDLDCFRANLYRYLNITVPEGDYRDYQTALALLG